MSILSCKNFEYSSESLTVYCNELAEKVVNSLKAKGKSVACAESCTGGMLAQFITAVSGASEVFQFGAVTYSERMKSQVLGIPPQLIEECGVVSPQVALSMAYGSKLYAGADIGVGITGIAGPSGGTDEMPVGTVWVSVASSDNDITENLKLYELGKFTREETRLIACAFALEGILDISER